MTTREVVDVAILFADIAKSTHLYETLGDKVARNLIAACISLMSDVTAKHGGTVIKTIGDEIMCTFPTADAAVDAAIKMHQDLEEMPVPDRPGFPSPNIYVGIQWGSVIREGNDVFGDAVNVAARMVALSKQRQIITTTDTIDVVSEEHKGSARVIDKTTVKGKSGEMLIYEILWEKEDATVMGGVGDSFDAMAVNARLEVTFHDQHFNVDQQKPSATLGRQSHNDVVVNDNRVSRSHARIEYRRGKFVLVDQSTNGTFVQIQGKKNITVRRDEAQLLGSGLISLGREIDPTSPLVIHFALKM